MIKFLPEVVGGLNLFINGICYGRVLKELVLPNVVFESQTDEYSICHYDVKIPAIAPFKLKFTVKRSGPEMMVPLMTLPVVSIAVGYHLAQAGNIEDARGVCVLATGEILSEEVGSIALKSGITTTYTLSCATYAQSFSNQPTVYYDAFTDTLAYNGVDIFAKVKQHIETLGNVA